MSLLLAAGSSGPNKTQSLAFTLDGVAVSLNGVLQHSQGLAFTLDSVSAAVSGTLQHGQSLTAQLDGVTVAAAQVARRAQSLTATLADITAAAAQAVRHDEAMAFTLAGVVVSVAQSVASLVTKVTGVSCMYVPGIVPADINALPGFIGEELNKIRNALDILAAGHIDKTYVAPSKPRDGDFRLADGTSWNPGSGAGFYGYNGGTWSKW